MEILQHLTDRIGPRLSGSPQEEAAVQWVAERMRADSLRVRLQPVKVPRWIRGVETGELLTPSRQRLPLTALGGSIGTPVEGITAEIVEVASFEELARLGDSVKGKIVYYHAPLSPSMLPLDAYAEVIAFRSRGAGEAARYGAVASAIRSMGTRSLGAPHTGSMYYADGVPRIPHFSFSIEAADLIHRLVAAGQRPTMRLVLTCRPDGHVESSNVMADLPGRELPDEIVVIGAHLDSWDLGSGAVDDAGGCAVVMEIPRLLRELGLVPRRTIRVVLFTGEEIGILGGLRYADMGEQELRAHVAALEMDQGADNPLGFRVSRGALVAGTRPGPIGGADPLFARAVRSIQRWAKLLEPIGASWVDTGGIEGSGADIVPLGRKGVLAVALQNDQSRYLELHHTDADTFDKINPQAVRRSLAAMTFLAYALAETPESFSEGGSRR